MSVQGTVAEGFEPVRDVFADWVEASAGTGGGFAAWHDGSWVVDLVGGYADAARTRPWQPDTLVMPYSVTKTFAAVAVLVLADRGQVDLDAPMTTYWPRLPGDATVRQVLCHTSGHVLLDEPQPEVALYDWDLLCAALERQRPAWPAGTAIGEAALFYGHLLGQVVRVVDGRTLGTFLREEVCGPHGLDFHVGVREADLPRVADLTGYGAALRAQLEQRGGLMARALSNPPGTLDPAVVNGERWRRAEVPAVNGHGTARSVAGLYAALAAGRILSEELLAEMTRVQAAGHDRVLGAEAVWGLGVGIEPDDGWGMGGLGGSFGWWSRAGGYAVGFVTGSVGARPAEDAGDSGDTGDTGDTGDSDPGTRLENAVRGVLGLDPV